MVERRDVVHCENLRDRDVAEHRDLGRDGEGEGLGAAARNLAGQGR